MTKKCSQPTLYFVTILYLVCVQWHRRAAFSAAWHRVFRTMAERVSWGQRKSQQTNLSIIVDHHSFIHQRKRSGRVISKKLLPLFCPQIVCDELHSSCFSTTNFLTHVILATALPISMTLHTHAACSRLQTHRIHRRAPSARCHARLASYANRPRVCRVA